MLQRQKLFLVLSLMAIVPLLFLLLQVANWMESDLEARTSSELQQALAKMTQEIATLMDTQQSLVLGLAKVPIVKDFAAVVEQDDAPRYESKANQLGTFFLNYQATVPSIQALRFSDIHGKTLVKIKEGSLIPPRLQDGKGRSFVEDIAYKPFFQWGIATQEGISISDFERGKVAGEVDFCPAMVRYSVPIRDELDTLQGLLTVNMWGRRVDGAVQATLGGYPGKAYIAELNDNPDRDGIYLYHENPDWRFANQMGTKHRLSSQLGEALWQQIKSGGQTGMVEAPRNRMLFYRKYSPYKDRDTQWLTVIEADRDTVLAPIADLRRWIGYLIAAAVVLGLVVARWAAARLARPVHDLAQLITRYADGDETVRYQGNRSDEIGIVGGAFNYLSESLEKAKRERDKAEQAVRQSERLAAIGQMAAGIGHEINNPLMNIMSLATLIEPSLPSSDVQAREDLRALQNEGRRCARIVHGILNFARETPPSVHWFNLSKLVGDTVALFQHRLDASALTLNVDVKAPLMIEGDASQIQQVLVNVLLNAIQASLMGSTITIRGQQLDDKVRVEVVDNGPGIAKEILPEVFNPFFTTKAEGAGTGLGLSISYGIVKKHGGVISLENASDGGVCARITLPVHSALAQMDGDVPEVINAG
jgi:two-component system NtrC family sensor kinase